MFPHSSRFGRSASPALATRAALLAAAAIGLAIASPSLAQAVAQPTAFTYQGALTTAGLPASGLHDFRFRLFDAPDGGTQVGGTICLDNVSVVDGRFAVTLDFGPQFASLATRHIEILVRPDIGAACNSADGYTALVPRQAVTPTPVAANAHTAQSLSAPGGAAPNAVFVSASGNVGIGTTTPGSQLDIVGAQNALTLRAEEPFMSLVDSGNANKTVLLQNSDGNYYVVGHRFLDGSNTRAFTRMNEDGWLSIGTHNPAGPLEVRSGANSYFLVDGIEGDVRFNGGTDGHFGFFNDSAFGSTSFISNGRNNLFISNFGQVGIGTTQVQSGRQVELRSDRYFRVLSMSSEETLGTSLEMFSWASFKAWELMVTGTFSHAGLENGSFSIGNQTSSAPSFVIRTNNFVGMGDVFPEFRLELPNIADARGRGRANSWTTYSSGRWKHNVVPIEDALDKVLKLRGVTFDWNAEHGGTHDLGFVAEEVGAVFPELVTWEEDGVHAKGLAYDRLTAVTVEAIKAQQREIDALKQETSELRAQLAEAIKALRAAPAAKD